MFLKVIERCWCLSTVSRVPMSFPLCTAIKPRACPVTSAATLDSIRLFASSLYAEKRSLNTPARCAHGNAMRACVYVASTTRSCVYTYTRLACALAYLVGELHARAHKPHGGVGWQQGACLAHRGNEFKVCSLLRGAYLHVYLCLRVFAAAATNSGRSTRGMGYRKALDERRYDAHG
jgi:hypothetical protein